MASRNRPERRLCRDQEKKSGSDSNDQGGKWEGNGMEDIIRGHMVRIFGSTSLAGARRPVEAHHWPVGCIETMSYLPKSEIRMLRDLCDALGSSFTALDTRSP